MLRTFAAFLCVCFAVPASAKLGETAPQLIKRFGKNYTIQPETAGETYRFNSETFRVDVLISEGVSVVETYFSDHPLTATGEPPNDIVQAVLKTNAPRARWVEIEGKLFSADYALQSSNREYIALLRYKGQQPEGMLWTMTVGREKVLRSIATTTPSPSSPTTTSPVTPTPKVKIDFSRLPDQLNTSPLTPAEIARRAFPSVVLLCMQDGRGQPISLGSGFFVDKGVIATNFHVIDQAAAGYAKVIGQSAKLDIKGIVGLDTVHDLALLQVDSSSIPYLLVAPKLSLNIGDSVYAIGNPEGLEGTFSQGIVSSVRTFGSDRILQITAPISPGSSGGPVLDQSGNVIGVSWAILEKGQNLNFAIPSDYVAALQATRRELRSLLVPIPRAKLQTALLGRNGNERPVTGVVGENFVYDLGTAGEFSFSLHNKLAQDIGKVYGFVVFYDPEGQPLDTVPINYGGTIPAHTAKRLKGEVDPSVPRLSEGLWYWDDRARSWHKATGNLYEDEKHIHHGTKTEVRKGKVEFRILDFSVQ